MRYLNILKNNAKVIDQDDHLKAFDEVYAKYSSYVRKTIYWMAPQSLVDDLVQEVFVKVWSKLDTFRNEAEIKTWIYRVTVNTTIDQLRKNKHSREIKDTDLISTSTAEKDMMTKQIVREGILKLSDIHRSVFVLFYKEELAIIEIAEVLKISEGTVKSRLYTARQEFITFLHKNGVSYE